MCVYISLHKTLYKCMCNLKIAQVQVYRKIERERKEEKKKKKNLEETKRHNT